MTHSRTLSHMNPKEVTGHHIERALSSQAIFTQKLRKSR